MLHSSVCDWTSSTSIIVRGRGFDISLAVTRVWDSVWVIQCHGRSSSSSSSSSSLTALPALFTLWTRASFPARIVKAKVCGKFAELCILGFCGDCEVHHDVSPQLRVDIQCAAAGLLRSGTAGAGAVRRTGLDSGLLRIRTHLRGAQQNRTRARTWDRCL